MSKKIEPGMAYDMSKLNKIFAFLSILLLLTVFWVFLDDYLRPWKAVQIKAMKIKREKIDEKLAEAEKNIDQKELTELEANLVEAHKIVDGRKSEINVLNVEVSRLDQLIKAETITTGQLNGKVAATTFEYESSQAHGDMRHAQAVFPKLKELKAKFAESKNRTKDYEGKLKEVKKKIEGLNKEVLETEDKIKKLTLTKDLLLKAKKSTDMNAIFVVRNSPLIDYLDPTLKIQQLVMKNITDDRFFQHVPKVDRCITCHTFIDQKGYEDQPNPYKTHPKLDLMVGMDSPHPMKQYGCTTCHGGEGHRVHDFNAAEHRPQNDQQLAEWKEKYNFKEGHKVAMPMLKLQYTESQCLKCHQGVEYVSQAPKLNHGRELIEKYGCNGCHKIEGWEHRRKPGPNLEKIASKISKEFFKNWVWEPKSFNEHARMPQFFMQSNNSKPEFVKKNIAEVNAMAEFIWSKSKPYQPFDRYKGGNVERGKNLVKEVGCMSCHGVEGWEEESDKVKAHAGPYLTGLGSKLDPDWLVSWLKKPSHYSPETIMPSFRLTDTEANDIAAFLLSQKNKAFERLKFETTDPEARDAILVDYFSAFDTVEHAKEKVASMSEQEKTLELGHRSIGKYGCFSCHTIDGFAGRAPIGPELTKEGSKPVTQFFFGIDHSLPHTRDAWLKAHLINPRRWDIGIDKLFKDLNLMPNFYMSEEEAESITLALLGQVSEHVPLAGKKNLNQYEKLSAEGFKVVNKYNCIGCHQVDGERGDLLRMYDDINEGPPRLVGHGERVQSDWLHHFLVNIYPIRPYLKVRMPSFNLTNDERNSIVNYFQGKSKVHTFEDNQSEIVWEPGERDAAKKLFNNLNCVSCHSAGFTSDPPSAPNLYNVKRKLRPEWIHKWLANPQAILEGTVMPSFWEGGESPEPEILGGDTDKQIKAITKYLLEIGYDKLPNTN